MKLHERWETGLEDDPKGRKIIKKGTGKSLKELIEEKKKEETEKEKS